MAAEVPPNTLARHRRRVLCLLVAPLLHPTTINNIINNNTAANAIYIAEPRSFLGGGGRGVGGVGMPIFRDKRQASPRAGRLRS